MGPIRVVQSHAVPLYLSMLQQMGSMFARPLTGIQRYRWSTARLLLPCNGKETGCWWLLHVTSPQRGRGHGLLEYRYFGAGCISNEKDPIQLTAILLRTRIRAVAAERGVWANIPPRCNRSEPICFSPYLYRAVGKSAATH